MRSFLTAKEERRSKPNETGREGEVPQGKSECSWKVMASRAGIPTTPWQGLSDGSPGNTTGK